MCENHAKSMCKACEKKEPCEINVRNAMAEIHMRVKFL